MDIKFVSSTRNIMLILLAGAISSLAVGPLANNSMAFAQEASNNTNSAPKGAIGRTNVDIPSLDFTLADGSSVSPDFKSIYFNSGGTGQVIYAYYDDYGLPENKPQFSVGDKFTIDAYPSNPDTPRLSEIQVSISKVLSGDQGGNFTAMKLDNPMNVSSSGNSFTIPNASPGSYILDTFVKYPFGGVVLVYTIECQIKG